MDRTQKNLSEKFRDKEYAHSYMESHTNSKLAAQIYWTRKKRGWSQEELAHRSGIAQERISKIEAGDFDSLTMKTLRKFAHAFDVNVHIGLEQFSSGIVEVCNQTRKDLELAGRKESLDALDTCLMVVVGLNGTAPVIIPDVFVPAKTVEVIAQDPSVPLLDGWEVLPTVYRTSGAIPA